MPEHLRASFLANNRHLDTAIRRREQYLGFRDSDRAEVNEVRAGWIALEHMTERALPLGPLAAAPARYVAKAKLHHRSCRLLSRPDIQIAPLGDIAHRPYCTICDGPGFDLRGEHLDYLWAVMAIDDLTDPHTGPLSTAGRGWRLPTSTAAWEDIRRNELAACDLIMITATAITRAQPATAELVADTHIRVRHQRDQLAEQLAAGPDEHDLIPPSDVVEQGPSAVHTWQREKAAALRVHAQEERSSSEQSRQPSTGLDAGAATHGQLRLIYTPQALARVGDPACVTGVTHQRAELVEHLLAAGRVRADAALAHPVWGGSYAWMAAKLTEKHPPSAGRALLWATVTNSVAHTACDSACGDGLPVCDLFHPYPGHASLLIQVPGKRTLLSNWEDWDHLVFGGYIPVDDADSYSFGRGLLERFGDDVPSPDNWPQDLLDRARASFPRCLRVRRNAFNLPEVGTKFVVSELRRTDVLDFVVGPSLDDADRWWDYYSIRHPDEADRRARSSATVEQLRSHTTT